jgi:hypothetical protein
MEGKRCKKNNYKKCEKDGCMVSNDLRSLKMKKWTQEANNTNGHVTKQIKVVILTVPCILVSHGGDPVSIPRQ